MDNRDLSELKLERRECERCGALWLDGIHHWRTGKKGNELDLAGLVCNRMSDPKCINPKKGCTGGDTWDKRAEFIKSFAKQLEDFETH
jgi:hypothetical protein